MPRPAFATSSYSTTEINKSGAKVYDDAWASGSVEITRRGQKFVLLRQDVLQRLIAEAASHRPQTLDDLLRDYDAGKIKALTRAFLDAPPQGKERI